MAPDIDKARTLQGIIEQRDAEIDNDRYLGPHQTPCRLCHDRGILAVDGCVRYCLCPTGREKKREWLALPAADRAPFEAQTPTLPDQEDLGVRKRGA